MRILLKLIVVLQLSSICFAINSKIQVLTYNILSPLYLEISGFGNWDEDIIDWEKRKPRIVDILLKSKADIICLQEIDEVAFNDIKLKLKEYLYEGVYGYHPSHDKDSIATFYNGQKFHYISHTLHAYPNSTKILLTVIIKPSFPSLTDSLSIINTKFKWDDENLPKEKHRGYQQLLFLKQIYLDLDDKTSMILCGDLNMLPDANYLLELKDKLIDPFQNSDYQSANIQGNCKRIDYIFVDKRITSKPIDPLGFQQLTENSPSIDSPSDHIPLMAEITLNENV